MRFPQPVEILDELFLRLSTHAVLYLTIPKALQVRLLTNPHVICIIYAMRSHAFGVDTSSSSSFRHPLVYLYEENQTYWVCALDGFTGIFN